MLNEMLNVRQVAQFLNYHEQTVRDLSRLGKLPARKVGRSWYYDRVEIADLKNKALKIGSTVSQVFLTQKILKK